MFREILLLFAFVVYTNAAIAFDGGDDGCGPNMSFDMCGGCPRTCDSLNGIEIYCPAVCVAGCYCNDGYVLNNGTCVLPKNCDDCSPCFTSGHPQVPCTGGPRDAFEGPSGVCKRTDSGQCIEVWDKCPCGGPEGWTCNEGTVCLDTPNDGCNPPEDTNCRGECAPCGGSAGCILSRRMRIQCPGGPPDYFEGPSGQCVVDERGQCVERFDRCPCIDRSCPDGQQCVKGECVDALECRVGENECTSFENCPNVQMCHHPDDDLCGICFHSFNQCENDTDCLNGRVCEFTSEGCECSGSKKCIDSCSVRGCPDHQRCDGNLCEPIECRDETNCRPGQCCVNGRCSLIPGFCGFPPV